MKLELKIEIDEINYAQAIRAILPYVKKEELPIPEMVVNAASAPGVLENFLKFIPKQKQDEMLLKTFAKNKERFISKAHRMAAARDIDLKISDISLEEKKDEAAVL